MGKDSFSVTTKVPPDTPKERNSKAFEAWFVYFFEAHPAITESEMLPYSTQSEESVRSSVSMERNERKADEEGRQWSEEMPVL